ncbi:MAG TPA: cytochrome c biogenesis protein CcdA [Thermoanaerobaculia bacterium]|nr:cytochrome c biogenesis protein CcdA [Thermoanaerobaculia bacterium]
MRAPLFAAVASFLAAALPAQFESPIPKKDLVTLTAAITQKSGDQVRGVITAAIEKGWHVNSAHPLESFAIPTTLSFESADLLKADFPPHLIKSFTFSGGTKLAVYEGTISIPFTAKTTAQNITAKLHYQACNDNVCLPPRNATLAISLSGAPPTAAARTGEAAGAPPASFMPLSAAPKDKVTSAFLSHGLPLTLLILFVGGLALNLTPCVFPMIPITLGFFAMQSDGRRSRRLALSAFYVAGLVVMYSALGVAAALSGKLFGSWLQHPAVLIGFALLMLVLASSMFGAWEMTVPQFIGRRSGGRAGLVGAAVMGLFVGIVAAPCVGPVVVALFTLVAGIGKPLLGFVMFGSLALGLGSPYLVALNAMPRPGEWMVQVKKAMGFVLVAMAFYFLRPLIGDGAFRWGVAASLLIGALFLFFSRGVGQRGGRVLRLACASLLLILGAAFVVPRTKGASVEWQKYDTKTITNAGKPVIVDFYADWCLPCKELDEKTFSDRSVATELDRFVRVKANLTNNEDPAVQKLTEQYKIVGVPTIVFLDSGGHELNAQRLTGFENPQAFVARLKQVR